MLWDLFTGSKEDLRTLYTDAPRSWVTEFPDVPAPDNPRSLTMLAVRWTCNDLWAEELPEIASALLEADLDTPALRRLAGETELKSRADAEPLVSRMFVELGVPYPLDEKTALLWTSRQLSREVIAGLRNPWTLANHLEIVVWGWSSENTDLQIIFEVNDQISREAKYRLKLPMLTDALIGAFARLAQIKIGGFPFHADE